MAKEMIAMLLAGGQGSRLYALTQKLAKPAVPFGGKYRIIDFPLSNCVNSGIDTVGILTQYQPMVLNEYIGNGQPWDLDRLYGGVHVLPPYQKASGSDWYKGTANAIYQNIPFIERYDPQYVIILSADLAAMGSTSQALMVVLMLLGGSPGSTAGGMKTTTFAVLLANMWATFRRREDAEFFGRRIDGSAVKNAATIAGMYLTLFFLGAFVIATAEQLPMSVCLYETASAVATVGLTLGITPQLGVLSQGVLIALMFLGRVGGLTLIYAAFGSSPAHSRLPQEKIAIG